MNVSLPSQQMQIKKTLKNDAKNPKVRNMTSVWHQVKNILEKHPFSPSSVQYGEITLLLQERQMGI